MKNDILDIEIPGLENEFSFPFNKFVSPSLLENEEYHKIDGISASGLKTAWKDPKLYDLRSQLKRVASPALDMGTATHEALLEPEKFVLKSYKLTTANMDKLQIMIHNGKLMFDYILKDTRNEESLFYQDNGFIRKVRLDAYDPQMGIIYDVKTTRYNSPSKFIKDAYEYGYHLQAAFYIDTLRLAGIKANYFAFLCVPSESPCEPFAVQITERFIEDGRALYTEVIQNIINYKQSNKSVFFKEMDLPQWRLKQILGENNEEYNTKRKTNKQWFSPST